ncbi:MAG: DUF2490 domain-containing protein [Allomuricauda sp.]
MNKTNRALHIILIWTFLGSTRLLAQEKTITHAGEQWLQYNNLTHISEKWDLFINGGGRWKDGFEEFTIFFGRIGAGFSLSDKTMLATGFTYVEFYDDGNRQQVEFRPYEEILLRGSVLRFRLNHRFRFEQRFYNPVIDGDIQSDNSFALRFRYAIMTGFTLFKLSKTNPDSKFVLNISDELMINAGKDVVYNVFDKNRFIITPTFQLNKSVSVAVAWNNQFGSTTTAGHYVHTNALWVHFSHTINLSKKDTRDRENDYMQPPSSTRVH